MTIVVYSNRQNRKPTSTVTHTMAIISKIQTKVEWGLDKYRRALALLLRFRFMKVDKEKFVRSVVDSTSKSDVDLLVVKALETSLADVIDEKKLKKYYRKMMWKYSLVLFFASFAFTLVPEDLVYTIVACVLDFIVFQCYLYIAMQKIMIMYGDDCDLNKDRNASVEKILAIDSSGLMIGKYPLLQKMKSVMGWLGKQVVKKLGPKAIAKVSRPVFVVIRRMSIKWFSVIVAKENVVSLFDALVPITCGVISGIVSVVIFVPMCNKLKRHLLVERGEGSENEKGK